MQRCFREFIGSPHQLVPIFFRERAFAELVGVDARLGSQHPLHQLLSTHFQTEDQSPGAPQRDLFGDVQGQRGFAHGRTSRQDQHFARLHALGHVIEFVEPCLDAT